MVGSRIFIRVTSTFYKSTLNHTILTPFIKALYPLFPNEYEADCNFGAKLDAVTLAADKVQSLVNQLTPCDG